MNILGIIQSIPLERKVTVTTLTIFILLVGLFSTSALASSVDINIFKFLYSSDSPDSTDIPDIPDAPTEDQPEPTELSEPPEPTEQSMKSKLFRDWEPIQWAGKGPAPPQLLTVNITALGNTIYINTSKYAVGVGNNTIYTSYGSIVEYYSNDFNQSDDISDNYIANYIQLRRAGGGGPVDVIPNLIANPNMSIQENGTQRAYLRYDWNSNEAVIHWYFYEDYYVGRFQSAISTTTYNDGIEILQVINDTNSTGGFDADGLTTANGSKASDDTTTPSTDSFPDLYDQTNDYWVTWFGTQANNLAVGRIGQAMPTGGNNIYSDLTDLETTGSDYFDQLWGASNNLTSYDDMFTITVLHNGSSQQTVEFLYSLYENPATIANFANTVNLSYNSKEFIYNASRSSPTANAIINVTGNAAWNRTNENIYIKFNNIDSTTSVWNSTDNVTWNLLYNNNMQFESNYVIFNVNQSRDNWMLYSVGNVTPTIDADGDGFDSTVDCNDSNATIRPLTNNIDNYINSDILVCTATYTNPNVIINASSIIFDGNGSKIIGDNTGNGMYASGKTGFIIQNITIQDYRTGIRLISSSSGNIIDNVTSFSNVDIGIRIDTNSNNNNITNVVANSNGGQGIYILNNAINNKIENTTANSQNQGLNIGTNNNAIINVFAVSNIEGIRLGGSSGNSIVNSTLTSNTYGVRLFSTVTASFVNTSFINSNSVGVFLDSADTNTIYGNNISSNTVAGINATAGAETNNIFNNWLNNTINAYDPDASSTNNWNTTKTLGTNIIGGPYIGGNFWYDYNGTDTDGDLLGDIFIPYNSSDNILTGGDFHPLVLNSIDYDGDGFNTSLDCNDNNATNRPLFNNTINNLSASIKICKDYYTNVTILINSSNLYIDGNGSTLNYTSSSDSNTIPDTINVSNTSPGLTNITIRNFGLIQTNVVAGLPMYTIQLPNVSVVTVTNNTLRTNETNQLNGFGDNWTIVNNTFNHTFLDTVNAGTGISSTVLAAGSNWNISKNFFVGGYIQIHITSADAPTNTAENWTISYNNFTSSYHENTFLTGLSNGTVHHNYMYNNSRTSPGCTGIWCYRGIYEPNSQQMDIYNNSVRNSPLAYLSAGQYNRWYNNSAENVTWGFYIGGNTQFQNITENNITNTTYGFYTALSTFYPDNVRNNTITRNTITNVSIDGIHFRTHTLGPNGNNTFSHNFINRTSTAQAGYGIYHHQNGTLPQTTGELRNNTIIGFVTAGIYIIDTQIGALDIVDNNITSTKLASVGLLTNGIDKANISNNTIDVIRYGIILTNTSNTTINKNSVTNITLLLSDHNNLSNMTFNNLNLTSSDNNNMTNINTTKVIFNMSTSNYMINGTNLGGKNSIRIDTSGSNKLLNFTHSFSNIQQINCGIPCPNIQGWWYVRANVTNTSGSPMNGATVRFNTSGDVSLFNTTTDATGITPFGLVMAYSQTQFLTNNSNFTAHANLTGLTKNSSFPQLLDSSRMFQIQLIDNLPPTIYLINYTNASTFTYKSPHNLSFNVTDPEQVNTSVTLFRDSSTNISFNASVQNNTLSNFSNVSFPLGTHSFWFSSNDGSATNVSFNYSITINQNPPVLNIVNFTNQSNFTGTPSIEFNMTDDQNSTTICNFFTNVTGNFSQNNSVQNNTISNFNLSGLADGSYMFWLTCNDGSAINATVTTGFYTFTQDTTLPTMLFYNTSTENNTILEQNWFFVNFTAQDNINIENTTLLLESGGTNISELNLNKFDRDIFNSSWWFNFTQMQTKVYNIRAIANDSLGNRQTANRTIILQYGSGATGGTGIGTSSGLQNITNITEEPPIITGALVTPTGFAGKLINLPFPTKILLLGILTICLIILADEREEKKKHRKRIQKLAEASAKNKPKTI